MKNGNNNLDLAALREKIGNKQGREYWRSLEELAETEEFQQAVEKEFPNGPFNFDSSVSRRNFLKLMGASMALAGLSACTRQPSESIFPYVQAPEEIVPGKPLFFATAVTRNGYANGVLVESHMGRPTKVEGNPEHPASLGATDIFAQACLLDLYDPDRSKVIKHLRRISTWEKFLEDLRDKLESQQLSDGAGLRILTETVTSPTLAAQIQQILAEYPLAKWHQYEPVSRDNIKQGAQLAFGERVETRYDFSRADVILSLDADFLTNEPGSVRYAKEFAARRKVEHDHADMNRLYAIESSPSLTGANADHRLTFAASEIAGMAYAIAEELGVTSSFGLSAEGQPSPEIAKHRDWIAALVRDLKAHRGSSLILAGESQPAEVHMLAHAMNAALQNQGTTVHYTNPVEVNPIVQTDSLQELVDDMASGSVEMLFMLGGNPVFNAPADSEFVQNLTQVSFRVHLGPHEDETSQACHWHIPQSHFLEAWGDARAYDGTATIRQPLIQPLYGTKSVHELLAALLNQSGKSSHDIVREYWQSQRQIDFERFWQKSVHDGVVSGTSLSPKRINLNLQTRTVPIHSEASDRYEIIFRPDPSIWDGRFANNGWLQELPKPLTKLTWDNAALIAPVLAEEQNLKNGDVVELRRGDKTLEAPVWITPGHPAKSVTLHFGYGRTHVGSVGQGTGFNVYPLRTSEAPWFAGGFEIAKTGQEYPLATTQQHHSMEGRHLVREATLQEFVEHPELIHEMGHDPGPEMTMYPPFEYDGYSWGMAVDLNSCIGCNACVVACQAENNIPVVGKEEVIAGREMHWIRVDRYFAGEMDTPETLHQPVMCMHCENAPCEPVCPVGATSHSDEGLNEMTYNRCVGTRYCSNNCPYKVRRFNFYQYADLETESLKMLNNPDVTVRTRGVMEKCTYCVQRINAARIDAKNEDRQIRDGEIQTACQQVCPADAIVFGDINDPDSKIAQLRKDHRNYTILSELGTRPRTSYLAKIRNPNPEIESV